MMKLQTPPLKHKTAIIQNYGNRSDQIINTLRKEVQPIFRKWYQELANKHGILLLAYSGYRTLAEQKKLREKYLSGGNKASAPGYSWHNYGLALDVVPININNKAEWDNKKAYEIAEDVANKYGIKWLGSYDTPHFQYTEGYDMDLLRSKTNADPYQVPGDEKTKDIITPEIRYRKLGKIATYTVIGILSVFLYKQIRNKYV